MKNLELMAIKTKLTGKYGPVPLYYSIKENAVYDKPGEGRFYMTDLIRYNDPKEIEQTVRKFLSY